MIFSRKSCESGFFTERGISTVNSLKNGASKVADARNLHNSKARTALRQILFRHLAQAFFCEQLSDAPWASAHERLVGEMLK